MVNLVKSCRFCFHCILIVLCLFRTSSDCRAQWQQLTGAPTEIISLLFSRTALYAVTSGGVYKSTDEGVDWVPSDSGVAVDSLGKIFAFSIGESDSSLLVSTWLDSGIIYRSTDEGRFWMKVGANSRGVSSFVHRGNNTYACAPLQILKSTDDGAHWLQTSDTTISSMAFAATDSFLFSGGANGVYRSSDDGKSWDRTDLNNDFIISLAANDTEVFAGSDFGGVQHSTDQGVTWTKGDTDSLFNSSLLLYEREVFDGTDHGMYRSTDRGSHWVNIGLKATGESGPIVVGSTAVSGIHVFAVTNSGAKLWALPLSSLTGVALEKRFPASWSLEQNYPDPFNPTTTISYYLTSESRVKLVVYNILGEIVGVIVDGEQSAGYKQVRWNASLWASGVYFYRLEVNSVSNRGKTFMSVKKMLLIR